MCQHHVLLACRPLGDGRTPTDLRFGLRFWRWAGHGMSICSFVWTTDMDILHLNKNISTVCSFFLYMGLHPSIQARARSEIDSVIGTDRLPSINDRDSLPFVRSVIAEVFRRTPALPLGEHGRSASRKPDYSYSRTTAYRSCTCSE